MISTKYWVFLWLVLFEKHCVRGPTHGEPDETSETGLSTDWFSSYGDRSSEDHKLVEQGLKLQEEKKFEEALQLYGKAIELSPFEPLYHKLRGECQLELGNLDQSVVCFREAINLDPLNEQYRNLLRQALIEYGRKFQEIVEGTVQILSDAELEIVGNEFFAENNFYEALRYYSDLIRRNPSIARYYRLRGNCYFGMKNVEMALFECQKAVKMDPQNRDNQSSLRRALASVEKFDPYSKRALVLLLDDELELLGNEFFNKRKFTEALGCYTEAIKKKPKAQYYRSRGDCYLEMGNPNLGISDLKKAIHLGPPNQSSNDQTSLRNALLHHGILDETLTEDTLAFLDTNELETLGNEFFSNNKFDEAICCLTEAIMENPTAQSYRLRGNCYRKMQKLRLAILDFKEVLRLDPHNEDDRIILSRLFFDDKKYAEAMKEILLSKDTHEIVNMAGKFLAAERYREALSCYSQAIAQNPEISLFTLRGTCYLQMNKTSAAVADFKRVKEVNPQDENNNSLFERALLNINEYEAIPEETFNLLTETELEKLGEELFSRNEYKRAARFFSLAIRRNPIAQYYRYRANCYIKMGNLSKALPDLRKVKQLNPHDKNDRHSLIDTLVKAGKYSDAIKETQELNNDDEIVELGEKFMSFAIFTEALRCYDFAIEKNPQARYYRLRGLCYWEIKNQDMAISDLQIAVEMDPSDENRKQMKKMLLKLYYFSEIPKETLLLLNNWELVTLGDQFCRNNKDEEAIRCYTLAIERFPEAYSYAMRGNCFKRAGKLDMALQDFHKAVQLDPRDDGCRNRLVEAVRVHEKINEISEEILMALTERELERLGGEFFSKKNFEDAVHCYSIAIMKNPFQDMYHVWRGHAYWGLEDTNSAICDYKRAVRINSQNKKSWYFLCEALFETKRYDELVEEMVGLSADELQKWGDKLFMRENFEGAIRCYSLAIEEIPTEASYFNKRGRCRRRMNELNAAVLDLKKAVHLESPSSSKCVDYRIDLGKIFVEVGMYAEAREVLIPTPIDYDYLSRQDISRMSRALWTIDELIVKMRRTRLKEYAERLITKDTNSQMDRIIQGRRDNHTDRDRKNKITEVKRRREVYLKELSDAFSEYETHRPARTLVNDPEDIPSYLIDKISLDIMTNPVITPSGITYEQCQILTHLETKKNDPSAGRELYEHQLRPNHALKEALDLWKKRNGLL